MKKKLRVEKKYSQVALLLTIIQAAVLSTQLQPASAAGHSEEFGLGIMLGEPTGLSGKMILDTKSAIDFGLAFSTNGYFLFLSDYLFQFPHAFHSSSPFISRLTPYLGMGGILATTSQLGQNRSFFGTSSSSIALGVRIPLGIEWNPSSLAIGVFAEIAPGIYLLPSTQGLFQWDIGIRFYF